MEGYRGLAQTAPVYPVLPQSLAPQPEPAPYEFNTPRGLGLGQSQIARGIQSAYSGTKAGLQGYGASIADALGAQDLAAEWYANAEDNAHQAELIAPRVRTIGAIQNPNDALDYGLGKVGEFAPYLVAGGGLGLLGRGVGAVAGLRGAELARAAHLTAAAGFQPMMAGEQALTLHNDPAARNMSPQEVLARSQGVGAAQAYVGAAVPAMMGGQLVTRTATPTLGQTLGRAASNSIAGGAGIAGMDVIGQMHRTNYDPEYRYNPVDTGEAFAGGVAGMLPIAGAHGAITHGLDKGVELPGKAYEASKTEAQRLYETAKQKTLDAIDLIPDEVKDYVKRSADYVVRQDLKAGEYWDEHLAPEMEALGTVGAAAKELFLSNVKATAEELNAARKRGTNVAEVEGIVDEAAHKFGQQVDIAKKTLSQLYGDTHVGRLLADDTSVPQHVKENIAAAKSPDEKLSRIAEAMSDPGKWFENNLTAADLKAHKEAMKNPVRQAAFLEDVVFALEEHGQETAAANQIRDLYKRVKSGEALSDADAAAMYITAKLALDAQWTERGIVGAAKVFENTRSAQQQTGKTIPEAGEIEGVQYAKSGQSFHENAMQAALSVADTSPELAKDIARRVQLLDIIGDGQRKGRGADVVVREAVSKALAKHGIDPQANQSFTRMYKKVLDAVNVRLGELHKEGSIPKAQTAEEIAETVKAFKVRVHEHVDEMLASTDVGKQLRGSPKIADHVADFVGKLSMGHPDYTQRAATRLFTQILAQFGDAGRATIDSIIDSADAAFGTDSRAAWRVGMLRENVSNIYDVATQIGKTVKRGGQVEHKSGNMVPNYALIGELLEDLDLVHRVDSKRDAIWQSLRQAKAAYRDLTKSFVKREKILKYIKAAEKVLLNEGDAGLRQRWESEGVVDAKKFNHLLTLVEKYDRHGDRLDRAERRPADHVKDAGRTVENISREDPGYLQAEQEGAATDSENPITAAQLGGRMGDAREDLIEQRREEKYGTQKVEKKSARFVGSEIFDTKVYNPKAPKLGAPVTMHAAGERATTYNSKRSEFGAMAEEAHTVYGHALTDARPVRMDAWAEEMVAEQGGTPQQHLNNALDALLEHDQRRLATGKLSDEAAKYLKYRAEMAERLKEQDEKTAGEMFFANKMNRSYRYYRVEQGNNEFLSYSADQLRHGYAVPDGMTVEQYAAREARRGPFAAKVYEDSLLPVEFADGKVRMIDIAKLVYETLRRHQSADTSGVGDKRVTPDKGQQILDAFHTVMGTLITTDGVKRIPDISEKVGKLFVSEDALGTEGYSQNFDPSLVIYREAVPHKTQVPGEPVEDVGVKNFFTLGQLGRVVGMDAAGKTKFQTPNKMTLPVSDRVPGQQPVGPGVFRKQDMSRIMLKEKKVPLDGLLGQDGRSEPESVKKVREDANKQGVALNGLTRVVKEKSYDETGTLVKPFVGDKVAYSVDLHALLVRMLERNNIDPHEALVEGNLPIDMAGMLLREAFRELKSMGYDGALFNMSSELFNELNVYTKFEFGKNEPVTLGDLKKRQVFDLAGKRRDDEAKLPIVTPRTLEDAKLHEVLADIKATEFAESDAKRRLAEGSQDLSLTSPEMAKLRADRIERAHSRTEWGLWRDPEREGEWDYSDAALALGRLVDRLGGTKDIPLQDKAEAVGGDRTVERRNRIFGETFDPLGSTKRLSELRKELAKLQPGDSQYTEVAREVAELAAHIASGKKSAQVVGRSSHDFDGSVTARALVPSDAVLKLYDRLLLMNGTDPSMTKFLEETFFLKDKGFEKWLDKRAAIGKSELRLDLPQRTTTGKLYTQVSENAPKAVKIAQRRADLKEVERVKGLRQGDRLKLNSETQRSDERGNVSLGESASLSGADAFERAKYVAETKNPPLRASRFSEVAEARTALTEERAAQTQVARAKLDAQEKVAEETPPLQNKVAEETTSIDIAEAIKDFSSREPKTRIESQLFIKKLSDGQLQEFLLKLPSLTKASGTVAEQAIRLVSRTTGPLKEFGQAQRERASVEFDGSRFKKIGETDIPFSKQQRVEGAEVSQAEADAIAKKLLGGIIPVKLRSSLGVDSDGLKIAGRFVAKSIELARSNSSWEMSSDGSVIPTGGGSRGTLHHEIWHAVEGMLKEMGPHGEKILRDIHAHMDTPLMKVWLKNTYRDAGVESQLDNMSERAAFVFQKLSEGVKMPMVKESKSILQHLTDFVRWVGNKVGFKTTTAQERSDNFMDYVMKGDFARDMDNAASVRKGLGEKNGDNIVHQAGQILKPGLEALSAVFQHTSTRIADLKIPEYDTVMELLTGAEGKGGYMNDKRRMEYAFDNEIGEQIKGMSDAQMLEFRASTKFVDFQRNIEKYMRDAGVEPNQLESFYKRLATLNADAIGKDLEAFITDLVNHGGFKGKAGEARTLANQIADRGFYYNKDRDLFPNRPDLKEKWSERDFTQSVARYIQQAVYLAERTRERTGNDGKKYRMSDLKSLLEAGNAKADSKGQQLMEDTLAAYEGTLASDKMSPGLRKFMGSLLFINNVRLLPKAVFSQMLEPMQLALRKGSMSGTLDTLWRGIREMPRSFDKLDAGYTPDKWERLANQIGTAPSRIIANVMAQMQNGMTLPGKIGHWNDQFFKLNFMDQWNRSMHIEATKHGVEFLKEHAEIVRTSKNADLVERSRRYLNELGVKESDIKVDGDGGLYIDVTNVGSDRVARAISQYVSEAMAHPDAGSNPMWMNDPRFALLAQMKRFTFAHSKYVLDRGIKEYKLGNAFPLVPAVLAMPWMLAADGLRDTLTMTDTSYKNNWGILDHMEHAWSRAGHAGRGQFFGDMEQSIRHGGSGIEGFAGPTAELFGRISRGAHTGQWFDSMVNQVPGAPMFIPD